MTLPQKGEVWVRIMRGAYPTVREVVIAYQWSRSRFDVSFDEVTANGVRSAKCSLGAWRRWAKRAVRVDDKKRGT